MGWFDALARDTHGGDNDARARWARLFMVPGMTHCGGGPALNDFDPLATIEQWVEQGSAPAFLQARGIAFRTRFSRCAPTRPWPGSKAVIRISRSPIAVSNPLAARTAQPLAHNLFLQIERP